MLLRILADPDKLKGALLVFWWCGLVWDDSGCIGPLLNFYLLSTCLPDLPDGLSERACVCALLMTVTGLICKGGEESVLK